MTGRKVGTVEEFVRAVQLKDVRVFEVSAKRRDGFDLEQVPVWANGSELTIRLEYGANLTLRGRLDLGSEAAVLVVDVGAVFRVVEEVEEPSGPILYDFIRSEGLPIIFPYLRVYIQHLAREIGVNAPILQNFAASDFRDIELTRAP